VYKRQGLDHLAERDATNARIEASREQRRQYEAQRQANASSAADIAWEAAEPCAAHPYLARKGVQSYGLRVGRWTRINDDTGEIWLDITDALLVPIRDGKKLVSLQAIFPTKDNALHRDKDFLPGGKKRGCFYAIGRPSTEATPTVVICEGYATAASIHEATGYPVVMAFDAGNLGPVAERIRSKYPAARIIIAADNDQWTTTPIENPGVHYARMAAQTCSAHVAAPEFADTGSMPTDFNDLHMLEGIEAVRRQIEPKPVATQIVPANDNDGQLRPAPSLANVDYFTPLPLFDGKGKPIDVIENLQEIVGRLGVNLRYNVIRKEDEIVIPEKSFSVDNAANASLAWLRSECVRFRYPVGALGDYVTYLADQNPYNPVINWVLSKPWDGRTRLQDLCNTILAEDEQLKEILIKRWMVSAVAAAFKPDGVSAHGVLTLQGDQYLGKTKWFKTLVPEHLGLLKDGMLLQPHDKDSVKQVCSFWLVELGELDATFRKSDIAALKSFITNQSDVLRRPFARKESHFARRTVFFASVNPKQFLHDATGNRRYWTIEAKAIDHSHSIDMQQLWAEVFELYKAGEPYYLQPEEMARLNHSNDEFTVLDPVHERLESKLDWASPQDGWTWRSATDILQEVGMDRPTIADVNKAAAFLRLRNGNKGKRTSRGRVILAPPRIQQSTW
jgi:putative DNA primase/helicase